MTAKNEQQQVQPPLQLQLQQQIAIEDDN